ERDTRLVEGLVQPGPGLGGGQGVDGRPAAGGVKDEVARQHPGVVGRRRHRALGAVGVADADPGLEPGGPDPAAAPGAGGWGGCPAPAAPATGRGPTRLLAAASAVAGAAAVPWVAATVGEG